MDDLISRQAAIDEAKEWIDAVYFEENDKRERKAIECFIGSLKNIPSAQPELKKGKWIPHRLTSREYIGTILVNVSYDYWFCDTCGYRVEDGQPMYNFCPNCGADMRGDNNGKRNDS